jgi:RHS repeat-associated protein
MDSDNAYLYGPNGTPFEQVDLTSGTVKYLISDALGSVRGVVSSSGTLSSSTTYDTWGNPETSGGLTVDTPFGFAGGYTDPTGLLYLINRYYDPATGQFLSVDPRVDVTEEPYAYTGDDPVNGVDPLGLDSVYVLTHFIDGQLVPYYVGRSKYSPAVERERTHARGENPRLNCENNDEMLPLDTGDLSLTQAMQVEEYVMGILGTNAGRGSFPMNQRHEIAPSNDYYNNMVSAVNALSDGGYPGSGPAFTQIDGYKAALAIAAAADPDSRSAISTFSNLVHCWSKHDAWSPWGSVKEPWASSRCY